MEEMLNLVKDHASPILFGSVRFQDMNREKQMEALKDLTFRLIFVVLLPYISTMACSFGVSVGLGILINEAMAKLFSSYESFKVLRRGIVLLSMSSTLASSLIMSLNYIITPVYNFIFFIIGLK
ncbi:Polysacc_synt_C domain-containing protein [Caenorhabditis elegans]|uniref:Polysacc_synt_C domain-containing protein n=1 Tax=Caenorhabditis elegans TaxID=6239 RepID=Q19517_CAEEL|nr:Polysacc_synt_C domain-containing protein [Caenorhabditis elegans]CAA96628.2 Polysacc_synt_C domain-containing protein [Caenorhabditis elegans]|eukprot:NP_505796.2 Uncharacterized protein CELE_F17C11.6 [Caenorhabditis elegans]